MCRDAIVQFALTLVDGGLPACIARDDHAGVAVEEPQAVVVLRHEKRTADVPEVLGEALEFVGKPTLDDGVPGGDTVGAATVGAEEAEGTERRHRSGSIAGAGRGDDASASD